MKINVRSAAKIANASIALPFMIAMTTYFTLTAREQARQDGDLALKDDIAVILYFIADSCTGYNAAKLCITIANLWKNMNTQQRIFAIITTLIGIADLAYMTSRVVDVENREKNIVAVGASAAVVNALQKGVTAYLGIFSNRRTNEYMSIVSIRPAEENSEVLRLG